MTDTLYEPAAALAVVQTRIRKACAAAGRPASDVTLTAVSKQQPWDRVAAVLDAGQRIFGENRVQEATERWAQRRQGLELRLIGPLQTNKAKEAVALFDVIETVDRPKLARVLAEEMDKAGKTLRLYIQVNTGEEPQKAGIAPQEADAFLVRCREAYGLTISGLMCIPPVEDAPAPHFALTAKIANRNGLKLLSMGMSADFAVAIQFGATHVRVGSAIFGTR